MGRIHFIGGEKGGVGKSLTARLLAQYFIDNHMPFIGFDSDQSHSTFTRFYDEFTSAVAVDNYDSLDEIVAAAENTPNAEIIVDLAAQTSRPLEQWLDESDIFNIFSDLDYQVCLWHVMDDGADSMQMLDRLLEKYSQANVQFIVVFNMGRGENFDRSKQTATYAKAIDCNAKFLTLNKLQPRLMQKLDFSNYSFWAAANNTEAMSITERQRIKVWLHHNFTQFAKTLAPEVEFAE